MAETANADGGAAVADKGEDVVVAGVATAEDKDATVSPKQTEGASGPEVAGGSDPSVILKTKSDPPPTTEEKPKEAASQPKKGTSLS